MEMRSSLGRVRGLGAAKEGVGHWWGQRLTAIALVPLSIWFVVAAISLIGADWAAYHAWISQFGNALLMILTVLVLFYHAALGMQVVIEDYVAGEGARVIVLVATKFILFVLAASAILAVILVALRS